MTQLSVCCSRRQTGLLYVQKGPCTEILSHARSEIESRQLLSFVVYVVPLLCSDRLVFVALPRLFGVFFHQRHRGGRLAIVICYVSGLSRCEALVADILHA